MLEWLPPGTELMQDVSPADWFVRSLRPWGRAGVRLWSFIPDGFEAYARVLHPARDGERSVPWAELGASIGVSLTPDIAFCEVSGKDRREPNALDLNPLDGRLPSAERAVLSHLLRPHTSSPDICWFCLWEGHGAFWSFAHTVVLSRVLPGDQRGASADKDEVDPARTRKERGPDRARRQPKATAQDKFLRSVPKVQAEARSYLLFRGPLEAAYAFEIDRSDVTPNIWWPDDRSWCVATEIDGYSTYVGGTRGAIDELLASTELEAIEVPHDLHLDPGPFPPGWR